MDVTLREMLAAREARAARQVSLNREYHLPILSFSMNIPGPVKDTPLIRRGFLDGCGELDRKLPQECLRYREVFPAVTGWEAVYVLDMDALDLKRITTSIEDGHGLGRLFDMDVLDVDLHKLDRDLVGGKSRDCMVCGAAGRGCASRRVHSAEQLQEKVRHILTDHFREEDGRCLGNWAVESLLKEVDTTPKPGLVDRRNNGSHRDMDVQLFYASARAIGPYFQKCARIGQNSGDLTPKETFVLLRAAGLEAEEVMYRVTGGINTHKGAIFTLGILCGAAGRLWNPEGGWDEQQLFQEVADMTGETMEEDFRLSAGDTAGLRLYLKQGIRGIRGEVARGLPAVRDVALPVYRDCLSKGLSCNEAGAITMLHLITAIEDTCLIRRGGMAGAAEARQRVQKLLEESPAPSAGQLEELDDWFIRRNLSPGGCADLLAVVYFLQHLKNRT